MPKYVYSVKVVNPSKKSNCYVKKLKTGSQFETMNELQKCLSDELHVPTDRIGYVEPGHGVKGKQQWLDTDGDLKQMYETHQRRKEILGSDPLLSQATEKKCLPGRVKQGVQRPICVQRNCQMLKN